MRRAPTSIGLAALAALALLAAVTGLALGSSPVSPADVLGAFTGATDSATTHIVRAVRGPTVLLALFVGACLGASGAATQGLLRNPLADPYLLGISGGAALGAAWVVMTDQSHALLPAAAFVGALLAVLAIHSVAAAMPGGLDSQGASNTLLLTGVVFNALAGALILVVHAVASSARSQELLLWLMGNLSPARVNGAAFAIALSLGAIGVTALVALGARLDILALGDAQAASLGIAPAATRTAIFLFAAVTVGAAVSHSGLIGFVGLLVPHMVRLALGPSHRVLILGSAIGGAAFLAFADAAARAAFPLAMTSLPVGAVTAVIGAPLFFVLLRRSLATGAVR